MSENYAGVSWDLSSGTGDKDLGRELQKRLTFEETDRTGDQVRGRSTESTPEANRRRQKSIGRKASTVGETGTTSTQSSSAGKSRKSKSPSGASGHHYRPGQKQPLRVAPHDPTLSLSDPGNLHPKRHFSSREHGSCSHRSRSHREPAGRSGAGGGDHTVGSQSASQTRHQNCYSGTTGVRRKSDSNTLTGGRGVMSFSTASSSGNNSNGVWEPALPPSLRNQHLAHKCSWTDGASVSAGSSSRSSSDLLASPGPSRAAGHGHGQVYSYSVPSTPNTRARRHGATGGSSALCAFEAFLPLCEIQAGLKKGEFFEGTLRVNPHCSDDSYISAAVITGNNRFI